MYHCAVAPFTGAWIEIFKSSAVSHAIVVAPFTGAWIEMEQTLSDIRWSKGRSLHGSVD